MNKDFIQEKLSMNNTPQEKNTKQGTGMVAGIIACVLAVLGILFIGTIFVPIATIVALIGTIIAIKNKNGAGIGVNILAWILTIVGLFTSPVLLGIIGLSTMDKNPTINLGTVDNNSRDLAKKDIRTISQALELYKLDNKSYPDMDLALTALITKPTNAENWQEGGYINSNSLPLDPWGNSYNYSKPGKAGEFDLWSFGADGKKGGTGENKDIGNWNLDEP